MEKLVYYKVVAVSDFNVYSVLRCEVDTKSTFLNTDLQHLAVHSENIGTYSDLDSACLACGRLSAGLVDM